MALLSDQDRQTVRERLAAIQRPVTLLFFTQTIGAPESAYVTRRVLDELVSLNDRLSLEEVSLVLDRERAAQYGIDDIPAVVLLRDDGVDTRIRFLGAPAGYEFMSLIEAAVLAGTDDSGLSANARALVSEHVSEPLDIRVFVTPTCPHCPRAVTLAHRLAVEHPQIRATCVEATEFMDLSRRYNVTGVPKTVVNDSIEILGALPEDQFVRSVVGAPPADDSPDLEND
ncbi:MAG TPA: thioredoxin family protein [Vicinamibacterales bacterium]|jgi:glutaredoxin-like protein